MFAGVAQHRRKRGYSVVGYTTIVVPVGSNLVTPSFKGVGGTNYDLTDLIPLRSSNQTETGNPIPFGSGATTRCNGTIFVKKLNKSGNYDPETYYYYTSVERPDGWYPQVGTEISYTKIDKGDVTLEPGEAFFVSQNYKKSEINPGQPVFFRSSGEVDLTCEMTIAVGSSLYGNSTPVEIDLVDIKLWRINGGVKTEFGSGATTRCNGTIFVKKLNVSGNYEPETYYYYTSVERPDGWYPQVGTEISYTKIGKDEVKFKAGESFFISQNYKKSEINPGQPIIIELPKPIK